MPEAGSLSPEDVGGKLRNLAQGLRGGGAVAARAAARATAQSAPAPAPRGRRGRRVAKGLKAVAGKSEAEDQSKGWSLETEG